MSEEWVETTLGELADITIGKTPPRNQPAYWTAALEYPFCTIADMTDSNINPVREGITEAAITDKKAKRVPAGALLMSFKLSIGRIGFASRDLFPNEAIAWLNPKTENLDKHYLGYWLLAQDLTAGSGRAVKGATLNGPSLRAIEVRVPPLPVQRRIVDLMTHLDSHLANLRAEREAVENDQRRLRESVMNTGEPRRAGDVFDILMGRQRSPSRATGPNMTRYLRAANVKDGRLELNDVKEMDFDAAERERYGLQVGDVLVSEGSGSADAVGAAAQWAGEIEGCVCIQNTLLRYRAVPTVTVPGFVHHWCRWAYESGLFRETANGTNILHIGSTRAVEMLVRWLAPEVQERHCAALDAYDRTIRGLAEEADSLGQARRVLLSTLLSGELEIDVAYDTFFEGVA